MDANPTLLIFRISHGYAAAGTLVAVAFLVFGLARVAPGARGAFAFRPLLLPGLVLLWPLVLWRWRRLAQPAREPASLGRRYRAVHRRTWAALAVLLPLALLAALALRQNGPVEAPPILLAAPAP